MALTDSNVLEAAEKAEEEATRQPGFEPIPGYRLIEPLGKGGFGEVWKCQAPGGLLKAIKFVPGGLESLNEPNTPADVELRAIERIKSIRHPFILYFDRVERIDGDLTIVMELAERNLCDVLAEHRKKGLPGIPRVTLLGYLREAAEALDVMNLQHGLQHLDVKPGNLFLVGGHVKVGDFSLVHGQLAAGGGKSGDAPIRAVTPGYAPPELFANAVSSQSDQYSLAIVFQELLTGTMPFNGKNPRQLVLQHASAPPNLESLPESDRPIVARALAKKPEDRYTSCSEFVAALLAGPARELPKQRQKTPEPAAPHADTQPNNARPDTVRSSPPRSVAKLLEALPPAPTRSQRQPSVADRTALPGYEFVDLVGFSRSAEVWLVRSPRKTQRLLKILYGVAVSAEAVATLTSLDHPALLPIDVLLHEPDRLILASDPLDKSLGDRLIECQGLGFRALPRKELLNCLQPVAEALDHLYEQHGLQHLSLHPGVLFVDGNKVRLADFGLMQLVWLPADTGLAPINPLYAPPELLEPPFGPNCDQYSLALIYYDLLTGISRRQERKPRRGQSPAAKPDLSKLDPVDRDIVARALDVDPASRWSSCSEFVHALRVAKPIEKPSLERFGRSASRPPATAEEVVGRLARSAQQPVGALFASDTALPATASKCLQRFKIHAPLEQVREQLHQFNKKRQGQMLRDEGSELVFRLTPQVGLWQRCLGRSLGLEVRARLGTLDPAAGPTDVGLEFAAFGPGKDVDPRVLQEQASLVLEDIRFLLNRRPSEQRFTWPKPFRLRPGPAAKGQGAPIDCQGKEISLGSLRFTASREVPSGAVSLELPTTDPPGQATVPARVVRVERCGRKSFEAVAVFFLAD
jgi:serine/threonine protein kinase